MNLTDYLTQPILLPEINIILLIALILFGITLTYNGYIDQKKGILLPNKKYWALPTIILLASILYAVYEGQITGIGVFFSIALILVYTGMVYIRTIGGADYFALCLSSTIITLICDWPFTITYILISGAFLPLINELMYRIAYIIHTLKQTGSDPATTNLGELWKAAKCPELRLIPLFAFAYWAVVIVWVLLFGVLY